MVVVLVVVMVVVLAVVSVQEAWLQGKWSS